MIKTIQPSNIPVPKGHYSPAVVYNGLVFVSGQLGIDSSTGELVNESVEAETETALRNVETILQEAGSDLNHVVQMTIYISDIELWGAVNAVYAKVLGEHRPARAIVPVKDLHYGLKIEIQAIATVKE